MGSPSSWIIVCATSVAGGEEAFSSLGRVVMLPEASIDASAIRGAHVLITRSKVKVNEALLEGSSLRFYGTATAGTDHVDMGALERRGIAWSEAAGSNANSVAEYVLCALAHLAESRGLVWRGKSLGIIGAGHVGSRLAMLAGQLGMRVLMNDPPLRDLTGDARYRPRSEVIHDADILSLHVPLTDGGAYPTRGLVDGRFFRDMKPGAVFINASRGEVVVEADFLRAAEDGRFSSVVLDVFNREPDIDPAMLARADLATPHIAGYSLDGRLKGTEMVYRAACRHLGVKEVWSPPAIQPTRLDVPSGRQGDAFIQAALLAAYHPMRDDRMLRHLPEQVSMRNHFQQLRQHYPERFEFPHYAIPADRCDGDTAGALRHLGFHVS